MPSPITSHTTVGGDAVHPAILTPTTVAHTAASTVERRCTDHKVANVTDPPSSSTVCVVMPTASSGAQMESVETMGAEDTHTTGPTPTGLMEVVAADVMWTSTSTSTTEVSETVTPTACPG